MSKECRLGFEGLDSKILLSSNPWYVESAKVVDLWGLPRVNQAIVAVVDSGIDLKNPELQNIIWNNTGDIVDGIDNDNNGFIDDNHGWNFANNNNDVQDGYFHGTAVAGVINAISNKSLTIMPLKFMDNSGLGYTGDAIKAINYAIDMKSRGFNIVSINCSFGGSTGTSSLLDESIKRANDNGISVITAAGNSGSNNDLIQRYPSGYSYSNTISVAATNSDSTMAGYSNYGKNTIDIAAPGSGMLTTIPGGSYTYLSGTSFAAPVVAGAVGLLKSIGDYTVGAIKEALMITSDIITGISDKVRSGFINIRAAYTKLSGQIISSEQQPVVVSPVEQIKELVAGITTINKRLVAGFASTSYSDSKPVVDVYINGRLRYRVPVNQSMLFSIRIHAKYLSRRNNLIQVRAIDSSNQLEKLVYSGYIKK